MQIHEKINNKEIGSKGKEKNESLGHIDNKDVI